jgi:hypothetical protein
MNAPALIAPVSSKASFWRKALSYKRIGIALISPMFMFYLFQGQASGSITDALSSSYKRYGYGTDTGYTQYIDTTPLLFPNPLQWFQK